MNENQIDYEHARNSHLLGGPQTAFPILFDGMPIRSLLDVGCGTGTWMRAALESSVENVVGIDGVLISESNFHGPKSAFRQVNFEKPFDLGQKFDAAICFEVAEHLSQEVADDFVGSICKHSDFVLFSAACPGQPGQHHVNCQWPEYWQSLFNKRGYVCTDDVRWRIWSNPLIDVWYRQNILAASFNPELAGNEPRLCGVIHPDLFAGMVYPYVSKSRADAEELVNDGRLPLKWYVNSLGRSILKKLRRRWNECTL